MILDDISAEKKAERSGSLADRVPGGIGGRRRILRSLMNIRAPGPMPEDVMRVQDGCLRERAREKGIVSPEDIPVIREGIIIQTRRPIISRFVLQKPKE